jgi:hypothetical protein
MRRWIIVAGLLMVLVAIGSWLYLKHVERERLWQELSRNKYSNVNECLQELAVRPQEATIDPARCIEIEREVDKAVGF